MNGWVLVQLNNTTGLVEISGDSAEAVEKARVMVMGICEDPEEGKIYRWVPSLGMVDGSHGFNGVNCRSCDRARFESAESFCLGISTFSWRFLRIFNRSSCTDDLCIVVPCSWQPWFLLKGSFSLSA